MSVTAISTVFDARIGRLRRHLRERLRSHHDAFVRRELADRREALTHRYEVGGDFSVLTEH